MTRRGNLWMLFVCCVLLVQCGGKGDLVEVVPDVVDVLDTENQLTDSAAGDGIIGPVDTLRQIDAGPDLLDAGWDLAEAGDDVSEVMDVAETADDHIETSDSSKDLVDIDQPSIDLPETTDAADVCTPDCGEKECGDDGCEGICGTCGDDDLCNGIESCAAGVCVPGQALTCSDEDACNGTEMCDPSDGCIGGPAVDCNDQDACTTDACDPGSGCKNINIPGCGVTSGFVKIDKGSFWMGSPEGCPGPDGYDGDCTEELGRFSYEELHYVKLTHDFELQVHEVTQKEWKAAFGGWNPSWFQECGDDCPIEEVSWFDSCAFANWKSEDAGLTPCYVFSNVECEEGGLPDSNYKGCMNAEQGGIDNATVTLAGGASKPDACEGYRLPTEAEWEYAARAGSSTAFYPSAGNDGSIIGVFLFCVGDPNLDLIGWYCGNDTPSGTKTVGGKAANSWGLKDMSGNVFEWCSDWHVDYGSGTPEAPDEDPYGTGWGSGRAVRGGAWSSEAKHCRSAYRGVSFPGSRSSNGGFRLARTLVVCGDGECDGAESCDSCPEDCGECPLEVCGDGECDGAESCDSCPGDCGECPGECKPGVSSGKKTAGKYGLVWVEIPAGCFMMGCSPGDTYCWPYEKPAHSVTLSPFDMLESEVTEAQYLAATGQDPSCDFFGGGGANSPVECIDWYEAKGYCEAVDPKGRLCTEAEWEYAARGGTTTKYYCGYNTGCLYDAAWFSSNSETHKHDVMGKDPNDYGLYDMLGNVEEWTADWWSESYYSVSPASNPVGPNSGSARVQRDFSFIGVNHRVSFRFYRDPSEGDATLGIRCCRSE